MGIGNNPILSDLSVEMQDFDIVKVNDYHKSFWKNSEGGSVDNRPLIHGGMVIFGSMNHNLYALDIRTGKEVWKFRTEDRIGLSSPILYKDSVIIGSYDFNVYSVDAKTGKMIWKFPTRGELASSGGISEGVYYFTGRDQNLYAIDCENGSLVWKFKTFESNVSVPTFHKEFVLFGSSDRNLYCLNKKTGKLVWKYETEEEIVNVTPFVVYNDIVFFGTLGNYLHAVDVNNGTRIFRFPTGIYGITRGQILLRGMLIQPTNDGFLYAFTPEGKIVWKFQKREALGAVASDGERIYVGCEDYNLYSINSDGKELWKFPARAPIWQPSTIFKGVVYFGSYDCNFYAIDAMNGTLIWKFRCPGDISVYPSIKGHFEARMRIEEKEIEEFMETRYDLNLFKENGEEGKFYKSRVTYQISTQYRQKGKYQTDSDD